MLISAASILGNNVSVGILTLPFRPLYIKMVLGEYLTTGLFYIFIFLEKINIFKPNFSMCYIKYETWCTFCFKVAKLSDI